MATDLEMRRERQREAGRKWKAKNKDRMTAYHRDWVARHPTRAKEIAKRCDDKRKEKRREYGRLWRERNKEKNTAQKKLYYLENREQITKRNRAAYSRARPEMVLKCNHRLKGDAAAPLIELYKNGCVFCGSHEKLEVDHEFPVSRGGSSDPSNLQWLCRLCNFAKGNMTTDEFVAHIRKVLLRIDART